MGDKICSDNGNTPPRPMGAVSGGLSRFEYDVGGQGDVMKLVVGPPSPPQREWQSNQNGCSAFESFGLA